MTRNSATYPMCEHVTYVTMLHEDLSRFADPLSELNIPNTVISASNEMS